MAMSVLNDTHECRPYPPLRFIEDHQLTPYIGLVPANEVQEWMQRQIIDDAGSLFNPDHGHLADADLRFMWASSAFEKKGRHVLGQAEEVAMRAGGWQKARMEQQMHEWFGRIPKFIITTAADYCEQCNDLEFCALVEHELYHIARLPMTMAHRSSTKRPECRYSNFAAMTSRNSLEWSGATVPARMCRKWWMWRTGRRRLLISMLPERAGHAC